MTLPFEDAAADDQTPLEVTIRVAQPSLLGTRAAIETDVVLASEAADWPAALDLLARLRQAATAAQTAQTASINRPTSGCATSRRHSCHWCSHTLAPTASPRSSAPARGRMSTA